MIGDSLTHYRITAELGEGGMVEVYRASDTKLCRGVAIKVLPASISRDATSLARFERDAKALASLNHPHIAAIHGVDADQGTHFLVLDFGLSKMEESVRGSGTPASDPDAPTMKAETTQPGAVMGTPAYMSAESFVAMSRLFKTFWKVEVAPVLPKYRATPWHNIPGRVCLR